MYNVIHKQIDATWLDLINLINKINLIFYLR